MSKISKEGYEQLTVIKNALDSMFDKLDTTVYTKVKPTKNDDVNYKATNLFESVKNEFEACQTPEQFRVAAYLVEHFKDVLESYEQPCVEMSNLVMVNKDLPQEKGKFKMMLRYTEDTYQKIENTKGFTFETFVSGVGGFIGIFCGYSMLQIPETFETINARNTKTKISDTAGMYKPLQKINEFVCPIIISNIVN